MKAELISTKKEPTREEQIAALTARYVIAAIMSKHRRAELEKWSKAALVRYYINCTTMKEDGPFTVQMIKNFQRCTLIDHITDYDVNLTDFTEEFERYGIVPDDLEPIINLYEVATKKGKQP